MAKFEYTRRKIKTLERSDLVENRKSYDVELFFIFMKAPNRLLLPATLSL